MLTLAATTVHAAEAQTAAPAGVKAALINHVSDTCPNFRQAGDWYSKVFNLDQVGLKETEVTLPFGKKGEQPYNVTAKDVPLTFLLCRTRDLNAPLANGGGPRPKSTALINHVGYTVADFETQSGARSAESDGRRQCARRRPGHAYDRSVRL